MSQPVQPEQRYQTGWWKAPAAIVQSARLMPDSIVRNTRISNPAESGPEAEDGGALLRSSWCGTRVDMAIGAGWVEEM